MKLLINKDILLDSLQKNVGLVSGKQNFPILNNVLFQASSDTLKLTTSDLNTSIITLVKADVQESGKTVIPIKQFIAIIRELPEQRITLELIKNKLWIRCGKVEFKINTFNPQEFPKIETQKQASLIKVKTEQLSDLVRLTSFCVGHEDASYVLNGIHFSIFKDKIVTAATDGKRLAVTEKKMPQNQPELKQKIEFVLPIKSVYELQKLIKGSGEEVYLYQEENKVGFDLETVTILTRPIEGEFPDYNQYIPPPQKEALKINRQAFLAALRRTALLTTVDYQGVKFEFNRNKLTLSKKTPQLGEVTENVECEYKGKNLTIGFNPEYIIDVLKNLEQMEVSFEFLGADKPAVLRQEGYVYLVLPMKI
jgi:DNA polymerase-3 subunit beta